MENFWGYQEKPIENVETMRAHAIPIARKVVEDLDEGGSLISLEYHASGMFHHVWRATYKSLADTTNTSEIKTFALRISISDLPTSLNPHRIRNEVASLQYVARNLPSIPVPIVYAWDDGSLGSGLPFIAESFIEGQQLSDILPSLSEQQRLIISHEIANALADLGETRFAFIGGLTPNFDSGPLVESIVFFDGRDKFYNPKNYNIGPYKNTKEYIISCYDREIFYWLHISKDDTEAQLPPLFEESMVINLVEKIKRERQALIDGEHEASLNIMDAEPRVLVHEDLSGSNILVHNGHLAAILDWEFSGIYPLSVMRAPRQILRISGACFDSGEEIEDDESRLHKRVGEELIRIVRQRGWNERDVAALTSKGHSVLNKARVIMLPYEE